MDCLVAFRKDGKERYKLTFSKVRNEILECVCF